MVIGKRLSFKDIIESNGGLHMTAYLKGGGDPSSIRMRMAGLVFSALERMIPSTTDAERAPFLAPLLAVMGDRHLLARLPENIGIFRTHHAFRILGLPVSVQDECFIADTFHVKPVLEWLQSDREFVLIGLGSGRASLFLGSMHTFRKIDGFDSDLLLDDVSPPRLYQAWREETAEWLSERLAPLLDGKNRDLYIVGESSLVRDLSDSMPWLEFSSELVGSRFRHEAPYLHCLELRRLLALRSKNALEMTLLDCELPENRTRVKKNLFEIATAVAKQRVQKLIVASGVHIFGRLDPHSGRLQVHSSEGGHEDDDVLDDLAQMVIAQGGEVMVAPIEEIPKHRPVLAILKPTEVRAH